MRGLGGFGWVGLRGLGGFGLGWFEGVWGGGLGGVCGGARRFRLKNARAKCGFTNRRNKGLISVDRRTSLLSYLQYPVPYQSRLQRIYRSQCPKGD